MSHNNNFNNNSLFNNNLKIPALLKLKLKCICIYTKQNKSI